MNIDTIETAAQSVTATVCENAALYGATPERDEFDTRDVWDADDAIDAVHESFRILAQGVGPDGFQLADERESLLWGFVNMLDSQTQRLDRTADKLMPDLRDLQRGQDGTEIKSRELELVTDRAQNLTARRDAFERMRDEAAEAYRAETGSMWRPRRGSHASQTGKLTSAAIDARDYQRARKDRKTMAHLPQGTLVAIAGGKDIANPAAVIERLDKARAKYADMVLVHGGGPGVEKIAASWAEKNGVHQIVCKPDWDRHGRGRSVPPQRRTPQPPAEGRHRVPRQRHHREPRRQGAAARHTGPEDRGIVRTVTAGRVVASVATRPVSFPTDGIAAAPSSSRALRAALAPLRSPPASRCALPPSAPPDASSNRRVMRPCTMLRMSAPCTAPVPAQSARHCLAHSAPQCPPLTRRGGSDPPGQPASISRSFIQHESGF